MLQPKHSLSSHNDLACPHKAHSNPGCSNPKGPAQPCWQSVTRGFQSFDTCGLASVFPVLPIGAESLPGEITAQGSAVAEQPRRRRRALDRDLARRDDARHGGRASCGLTHSMRVACCVTADLHRLGGSGDGRPASAAAPGSVRTREGAASADAPSTDRPPPFPSPSARWCCRLAPARSAARAPALLSGRGPALACRRRALEGVQQVCTEQVPAQRQLSSRRLLLPLLSFLAAI